MRTRCPACGATLSLDALIAHDDARAALAAVFKLSGSLGGAVIRYLALHRPAKAELTMARVAKLLGEILPDIQAQRVCRDGQTFDAPPAAWIFGIEQSLAARDAGRLKTPLKGHGWLYEVISSYRAPAGLVVDALKDSDPLWAKAHVESYVAQPAAARPGKPASKTLSGISALEGIKHGKENKHGA